jgi:hypothetical protein
MWKQGVTILETGTGDSPNPWNDGDDYDGDGDYFDGLQPKEFNYDGFKFGGPHEKHTVTSNLGTDNENCSRICLKSRED